MGLSESILFGFICCISLSILSNRCSNFRREELREGVCIGVEDIESSALLQFTHPIKVYASNQNSGKKHLLANYQTKLKDNKNVIEQKTFKIIAIHMNLTIKTKGIVHHS